LALDGQGDCESLGGGGAPTVPPGPYAQLTASIGFSYGDTCAVRSDAQAICWGENAASVPPGSYAQISAGSGCALTTEHQIACWGRYSAPPGTYSSISTTSTINEFGQSTCAVTTTGSITCWGSSYNDDTIVLPAGGR
jgi:hypothetical protein